MVKVSVIVPVYNVEKYLKECLESIINQTLYDIEIICINDGSTDKSLNILKDFARKDSRIIVINKKNEGQSVARNIGIERATGEYLGFVDSDDWVDLNYFENLYNTAKKYNCDIACAGFKVFRKHKLKLKKRFEKEIVCKTVDDKIRQDNLPNDNYIWNKLYRRSAWDKLGIVFEPKRYYEDIALIIKILHRMGEMVVVPEIYYNYRVNPNSTVRQKTIKHSKDYRWAMKELYNYAENNDIKLSIANLIQKKEYYKIFNFTLFKVYYYESLVIYKLFGIITLFKKVIF